MSSDDLVIVWVLAAAVLVFAVGLWPQLFAVCQDEEHARVSGVPARTYGLLIAVLAAVTVTVSMRTVGLLLVSALMVVPVATAQQLTRSFRTTFALAMVLGVVASLGGRSSPASTPTPRPGRPSCCSPSPASRPPRRSARCCVVAAPAPAVRRRGPTAGGGPP